MICCPARYAQSPSRALASGLIEGEPIRPFKFSGTRRDDPNDAAKQVARFTGFLPRQ